jgi:hypothetical protein
MLDKIAAHFATVKNAYRVAREGIEIFHITFCTFSRRSVALWERARKLNPLAQMSATSRNTNSERIVMKKTLVACAAAATIAAAALAPTTAEARGGAIAAGLIGGLALGAIIGSAAAANGPYYAPAPAYYGPPPGCYWQTQRFWDGYGWRFNRVRVCN